MVRTKPKFVSIQVGSEMFYGKYGCQQFSSGNAIVPFTSTKCLAEIGNDSLLAVLNLR